MEKNIRHALLFLDSLNAVYIDEEELLVSDGTAGRTRLGNSQITPLGYHLAALPINPRIGKLILYSVLLGCLNPILTIAAMLSGKSPFISSFEDRNAADMAKLSFLQGDSDLLGMLNAYAGWKSSRGGGYREEQNYCMRNCLSLHTLQQIDLMRQQFLDLLKEIGFVSRDIFMSSLCSTDISCNRYVQSYSANSLSLYSNGVACTPKGMGKAKLS